LNYIGLPSRVLVYSVLYPQDTGKKMEEQVDLQQGGGCEKGVITDDRERRIITREEEAKARIAEKRKEMKVSY